MIVQLILPLLLAYIMFTMGLGLTPKDFTNVFKVPRAFSVGLILQVLFLPLIAFGIASFFDLPSFLSVGLIIIACCPGGVTSNYLTHIAKGDTALSVSLTAVASLLGILTIPIIIKLGLENFSNDAVDFSVFAASIKICLITTIPVSTGMIVRHMFPDFTQKHSPKLEKLAGVLFILIVVGGIIKYRQLIFDYLPQVGLSIISLNLATMFSAILVARLLKLSRNQEITLTIECGFQNVTLAMVIATSILQSDEYMVTAGIYGTLMYFTAAGYLFVLKKTRT